MKTCKYCNKSLPETMFYEGKQRERGKTYVFLDSFCIPCRTVYQTERRRAVKKQAVDFLGGSCELCGLKTENTEVYDFHHKDPASKDFSISKVGGRSFAAIKKELAKCRLLCANCHRLVHAGKTAL